MLDLQFDRLAGIRVLGGVLNEILEQLAYALLVGIDAYLGTHREENLPCREALLLVVDGAADEIVEVERLQLQDQPRVNLR